MSRKILSCCLFSLVLTAVVALDPALNAWLSGAFDQLSALFFTGAAAPAVLTETASLQDDRAPLGVLTPGLPPRVGGPAPDFALRDVHGRVVRLSDYKGSKAVVLNFWATWCEPCKREMPDLERVFKKYGDQLVVIGIDMQEPAQAVYNFLRRAVQVSYPILLDETGVVSQAYNLFAQPTTFFVDKEGGLAAVGNLPAKFGAFTPDELEERVAQLLALTRP